MKKIIISSMLGNCLEWYDFIIYAQLSSIISLLFFPNHSESLAMISTFGIFAVGFMSRPLGGIILGFVGDKSGRKTALFISMLLMAISTFSIGLIPNFEQIGVAAPILLVIMRLIQGLSMGGESGGSFTFVGEHAPSKNKGFYIGLFQSSTFAGILLGSLVIYLITHMLSEEDLLGWGWKIPFFLGGVVGFVGFYIRKVLTESSEFTKAKKSKQIVVNPMQELFKSYKMPLFLSSSILIFAVIGSFVLTIFLQNYFIKIHRFDVVEILAFNSLALVIALISSIASGYFSDKYGKLKIMSIAATIMIIAIYPFVCLLKTDSSAYNYLAQIFLAIIVGVYTGPVYAVILAFYKANVRFSAMTLIINIVATCFGGTIPVLSFWLIDKFGKNLALDFIGLYMALASVFALYGINKIEKYKLSN